MLEQPRLMIFQDKILLVNTKVQMGEIVDVAGPYQMKADASLDPQNFVIHFGKLLHEALHGNKVLKLEDLSEELQNKLLKS
jgi:ubiquitin C-terminal hydrolase